MSAMQHLVALLLLKRQNGALLLIEKGANACYYIDTARETKTNQNKGGKENGNIYSY